MLWAKVQNFANFGRFSHRFSFFGEHQNESPLVSLSFYQMSRISQRHSLIMSFIVFCLQNDEKWLEFRIFGRFRQKYQLNFGQKCLYLPKTPPRPVGQTAAARACGRTFVWVLPHPQNPMTQRAQALVPNIWYINITKLLSSINVGLFVIQLISHIHT